MAVSFSKETDPTLLELFVLALLYDGDVITHYELQRITSVSSGLIVPALRRLRERKYIEPTSDRPDLKEYKATREGKRALTDRWLPVNMRPPRDLCETVQIAWLALALGKKDVAIAYLRDSSRVRIRSADQSSLARSGSLFSLAEKYRRANDMGKKKRLRADADVLEELAGEIEASYPQPASKNQENGDTNVGSDKPGRTPPNP
jgi:DNA-binding PadR family transcriptional regulator